jgi:hypothetical protein
MKILVHFFLYFNFFQVIAGLTKSFVYEMYASNESNGNPISSLHDSSINKCVALCDSMFGCLSANFHEVKIQCELTDYYPLDNTTSGIRMENFQRMENFLSEKLCLEIYFRVRFVVQGTPLIKLG